MVVPEQLYFKQTKCAKCCRSQMSFEATNVVICAVMHISHVHVSGAERAIASSTQRTFGPSFVHCLVIVKSIFAAVLLEASLTGVLGGRNSGREGCIEHKHEY